MYDLIFIVGFSLFLIFFLTWGFMTLPGERWQFIAAVPTKKLDGSVWTGFNLTYYGFFSATAYLLAAAVLGILLGSISVPVFVILLIMAGLFIPCAPAARYIARIVEKKPYTFSVQAAFFVGMITAPWLVVLINGRLGGYLHVHLAVPVVLAAVATTYALGEGIGRLACISFGCCYGKPMHAVSPVLQRLFGRLYFIFTGKTKKIAYASGLEGMRMLPIQAVTAVVLCLTGVVGICLFLNGYYVATFLGIIVITQLWRFASEFVRADHRGGTKISAYQLMGIIAIFYSILIAIFFPVGAPVHHDIVKGLATLWHPAMILFLQGLWVVSFIYTGRSRVTAATLSFLVLSENT